MFKQTQYEILGAVIAETREIHPETKRALNILMTKLVQRFKTDNARFRADLFIATCRGKKSRTRTNNDCSSVDELRNIGGC